MATCQEVAAINTSKHTFLNTNFMLQLSIVIMQCWITWYCIHHYSTEIEYKSEFESTKDTSYLALTGKLWGVFCEDFRENWSWYNGTALYVVYLDIIITSCHVLYNVWKESIGRGRQLLVHHWTRTFFQYLHIFVCMENDDSTAHNASLGSPVKVKKTIYRNMSEVSNS